MRSNLAHKTQSLGQLRQGRSAIRMLCDSLPTSVGGASWIQILPIGPMIATRDGRAFQVSDLGKVVGETQLPMLIDWEHSSESYMGSTEAAGWVVELAIEPGGAKFPSPGLWGRVDWTPKGKEDTATQAYRYVSPVVIVNTDSGEALYLSSVALTNRPALSMQAIETMQLSLQRSGARSSSETAARLQASGLTREQLDRLHRDGLTDEQIIAALDMQNGSKGSTPSPGARVQFRGAPAGFDAELLRERGMSDAEIQRAIDYQNQIAASRRGE